MSIVVVVVSDAAIMVTAGCMLAESVHSGFEATVPGWMSCLYEPALSLFWSCGHERFHTSPPAI